MKWWFWTGRIFIIVGIIETTIGIFLFCLGGNSIVGEEELKLELGEYGNITSAFFCSGVFIFIAGAAILVINWESKMGELKKNNKK